MIPGEYKATVESHTWVTSASKGTVGLRVVCMVYGPDDNMRLDGTIWFSDKARGFARSQLKALGFDPDKVDVEEIGDSVDLAGNDTTVSVEESEYRGMTTIRIGRFGGANKPTKKALKHLSASLRTKDGEPDEQPAPEEPEDGDSPF